MKILLGIQPTWRIHIGNYFGAIKKGLDMQEENEVKFLVANYHANSSRIQTMDMVMALSKLGAKDISRQYDWVLELFYSLAHSTNVAELMRLPQYQIKEKTLHMLSYPLLMACDIIRSWCDAVIVWEDQETHMHFYREVARRNWYKEAVTIKSETPKIMSIKDPSKKMSKSLGDDHCIYIDDTLEDLKGKLAKSPTTPEGIESLKKISYLFWYQFNEEKCGSSKWELAEVMFQYFN